MISNPVKPEPRMSYRGHDPLLHDQRHVGAGHARDKFFDRFVEDFPGKGLLLDPTTHASYNPSSECEPRRINCSRVVSGFR
uniref:Uncharacterized protein n=1 Tax=Candidatus Kentrum sp. MB TaxID=2138164 RepID=A0A450XEQ4_9GAMM|nr:MAG: hypothetical protein BECKMB1821G_GA0114241_100179 [Candidatus Kentron sp. MB]VFK27782.1 MAG: hypothetical protein BECKMB1821I_GA0114274_100481 [Candidatus Kentron sp. MB]VFK74432.1 MAG: hypothetical protein BECKMB1821H_GA0114242_100481 [Candidatus Kentron sp. MB]